ncbi:MAG: hypothetical protein C0614_08300 [Desulfuromonas sp.]|nr:MAG: hypothetical protein C0614_08300 [Desulfuromonas sp.]
MVGSESKIATFRWKDSYVLKRLCQYVGICTLGLVLGLNPVNSEPLSDPADDTMLMFVGETEPVVTVASLSPEAATTAPAIATVITREEIDRAGYRTLGELLANQPGFFVAEGGRGSVPYLRGLRDSVLFLYDGVPMTTDVTKSFAPLDHELSLFHVDRVEIVRGPGSVLWGFDAYAGVINIVPRRTLLQSGTRLRGEGGEGRLFGLRAGQGLAGDRWDGWLSASLAGERYYAPEYQSGAEDVLLNRTVDPSEYAELVGTFNYGNWLHLSGRWSEFNRHYTLRNADEAITWDGEKQTPVNLVKIAVNTVYGPSHYALSAYYQETDYQVRDADVDRQQNNSITHLELLWDRRVFGRGLVTAGASWRHNRVDDALIRDGFQPDFLLPGAPLFKPALTQKDFSSDIYALFAQLRYRWDRLEGWLGARLEDHSDYDTAFSSSMGVQSPIGDSGRFKLTYGNAFRTPYSIQLFDEADLHQEEISTLSAQLTWAPDRSRHYELTLFHNRIRYHRGEDPYGGLSLSSAHEMYGAELLLRQSLTRSLTASAILSWFEGDYEDETYNVLEYSIVPPDGGDRIDVYDSWSQPADLGPRWLARLSLDWAIAEDQSLRTTVTAGGRRDDSFLKGGDAESYRTPVLVDMAYSRPGFFDGRDRISLRVTNLFDRDYDQPDIYGPTPGQPRRLVLTWSFDF